MPLILAPTGFTRIADPQGELAVARAAERAGLPYSLSTMGTRSIEEVAAVSDGDKWFQVYTWRDRGLVEELVGRVEGGRLHDALADRRHRGARPPRTRRAARVHAAAEDRARAPSSTARSIPGGPGTSCATSRSRSPTSSGSATTTDGSTPISLAEHMVAASSTRRCRGTTSTGSDRSGTGRSC